MKSFTKRAIWFFGCWFLFLLDNIVGKYVNPALGSNTISLFQICGGYQLGFIFISILITPLFFLTDDAKTKTKKVK